VGSKDVPTEEQNNLYGFARLAFPKKVALVFTGPTARHVVAVDDGGNAWTWGRNTNGQLGHGDVEDRALPCRVKALPSPARPASTAAPPALAPRRRCGPRRAR
jgi:alpha-tubulin suppressor-like RCC1 family protein